MALRPEDERHLLLAIELARPARANGDHPFGSLLVGASGQVVLEAENSAVTGHDVTGHVQLNLVRAAGARFGAATLEGATLDVLELLPAARAGEAVGECEDWAVIVRRQRDDDYEAIRDIYAAAFARPEKPESVPLEVGIFDGLWEAGDVLPKLSFTALNEAEVVGHVTASRATVAADPVVAVGPIGVLPEHQRQGIGNALMDALLVAADAADVPMIVLLGSPHYYGRFRFRPARELGVTSPEPTWGDALQARPLTAYTPAISGPFQFAPAFSS
ncbi:MAG TPA: GNAT family N-acetyltransferase [Actinomycetota bacterium]|nr:GNAT family N-acetyltransferase [Actinomycetota bacterium]